MTTSTQHRPARSRRIGVITVIALVATTLVALFGTETASAAPQTLNLRQGVGGYSGNTDATIQEEFPTTNLGDDDGLGIFGQLGDPAGLSVRSLVRFDLTAVPRGSTVSSASVTFTTADPGQDVEAFVLNRAWNEAQATWNNATGTAWATAGAEGITDRGTTVIGNAAVPGPVGETVTLPLNTSTVQGWVNTPASNNGFILISSDNNDTAYFYSSERADSAQRPIFTITFEEPAPVVVTTASPLNDGMVDSPYNATLAATGGTAPYTWAVTSGSLPAGLTLSSSGVISGTPTGAGTANFTVTATDFYDATGVKPLALTIDPKPTGGSFVAITPSRALDTRITGPCVSGPDGRELAVAPDATAGVPADAAAVVLNVTVTGSTAPGFLTVYPTGSPRPTASNLNFAASQTVPNLVTAKVGTGGKISIYGSGGCPQVVVDIAGFYTSGDTAPGGFVAVTPSRALDTRITGPCVSGPDGRELVVAPDATAGVPADAAAVALNVTVTGSTAPGFLTVYPTGSPRPTASNLNFAASQTVPNHVTAKVGTGGKISIYGSGGCPQVVVDIAGYYAAGEPGPGGFVGITPSRALDTRITGPCVSGPDGRELVVAPDATAGVPADATAVVLNVTVTGSTAPGFLTVYPTGSPRPTASNLNFAASQTVPNAVTAKVGTDGKISIYGSGGCPQVVVDVVGFHVGDDG